MGKTALLFPGQGSQVVGMLRDVFEALAPARAIVEEADQILGPLQGQSLSQLMFEGPDAALTETSNAQPAIFVASVALLRCLTLPADVAYVAGHSVGEYSALVASGAMEFEAALRLVRERGLLMSSAGRETPGGMLAVIGLDEELIEEACLSVAPLVVCAANYNAPGQTIVSGERAGLEAATVALKERGARRVIPLNVSAAFHSPVMAVAALRLAAEIESVPMRDPRWPVIGNVAAQALTTAGAIRAELAEQIAAPVRWHASIQRMIAFGVNRFIEVGPGKALTGMVKRIDPTVETRSVSDLESVKALNDLAD